MKSKAKALMQFSQRVTIAGAQSPYESQALIDSFDAEPNMALTKKDYVFGLLAGGKGHVVKAGLEHGKLAADFELDWEAEPPQWLIHGAAATGAVGLLRCLVLEHEIDPNIPSGRGTTPLIYAMMPWRRADGTLLPGMYPAVEANQKRAALFLIQEAPGINLDACEPSGCTALMAAAAHGLLDLCKAMVAGGADVDKRRPVDGATALTLAIFGSKEETALFLVQEAHADWSPRMLTSDKRRYTALALAASRGLTRLIQAIVMRMRAEGLGEAEMAEHMAHAAASAVRYPCLAGLECLRTEGGLDLAAVRIRHEAEDGGDADTEKDKEKDEEEKDKEEGEGEGSSGGGGGSCCSSSSSSSSSSSGSDSDSDSDEDEREHAFGLLHFACDAPGKRECAEYLLDKGGCDPLAADELGLLPHHWASNDDAIPFLEWYFARTRVPVDALGSGKMPNTTLLHMAAVGGHAKLVKWLIEVKGADPASLVLRPSGSVKREQHPELYTYLVEAEAKAVEAAARKARNEKRRQKLKKKKMAQAHAQALQRQQEPEQEQEQMDAVAGLTLSDDEGEGQATTRPTTRPTTGPDNGHGNGHGGGISLYPFSLAEFLSAHAPADLVCPITDGLVEDPVVLAADGFTYSRAAIEAHLDRCRASKEPLTSPKTGQAIEPGQDLLVPNLLVKGFVSQYVESQTRAWEAEMRRWRAERGARELQGQEDG